jgi:O-antigen/teichoic acid export membrane protein
MKTAGSMSPKSILKNTIYIIGTEQLSRVINFFQVAILIRYLGKNNYGIWSLTQSIPSMFYVLTDMGLNSIMLRKIARDKINQEQYLSQVLFLKVILAVLFFCIIYIFSKTSGYETEVNYLILFSSLAYLFGSFSEVITAVFRAHENFAFESIINTIKSAVFLSFVCAIIFLDLKLRGFVFSLLILNLMIGLVCFYWYSKKFHLIKLKVFKSNIYRDLFKESLPFALLVFINPVFSQIDIVMLSKLSTYESVGIYNAAYRIFLFLFVIPIAIKNVLFPRLSNLYSNSTEAYESTFNNACRIIVLLTLPMCAGLYLLSDRIVVLLFSKEYMLSVFPLRVMAICLFFANLRTIFGVTLYASNLERPALIIFGTATILNGVLDYLLIPKMDYTGAALSSLFAEVFILLSYYHYIRKKLSIVTAFNVYMRISLSVLFMGITVLLTKAFPLFVQIIIAVIVYGISIRFFNVLTSEDYLNIRALFKMKMSSDRI